MRDEPHWVLGARPTLTSLFLGGSSVQEPLLEPEGVTAVGTGGGDGTSSDGGENELHEVPKNPMATRFGEYSRTAPLFLAIFFPNECSPVLGHLLPG